MKSIEQQIKNAAPVRAGRLLLGALGTLVLLTACGGTETPKGLDAAGKATGVESGTKYIRSNKEDSKGGVYAVISQAPLPEAGTPLGTIIGDKNGTVTVVPEQDEITVLQLVNEVRATNTINGKAVSVFGCNNVRRGLPSLRYSGLASYAAEGHANYLTHNAIDLSNKNELHDQLNPQSEYYTGRTPGARFVEGRDKTMLESTHENGEIVFGGSEDPITTVKEWLASKGHCEEIFNPRFTHFGAGKSENPDNDQNEQDSTGRYYLETAWVVNFAVYK